MPDLSPQRLAPHNLLQVQKLRDMARAPVLSPRDAVMTATQLVNHGFAEAPEMIARLRRQLSNIAVQEYLDQIENRFRAIAALRHRDGIMADRQLMHRLYHPEEPVFVRNPSGKGGLMLALATMFNNFQVSNAIFAAVLLELGLFGAHSQGLHRLRLPEGGARARHGSGGAREVGGRLHGAARI